MNRAVIARQKEGSRAVQNDGRSIRVQSSRSSTGHPSILPPLAKIAAVARIVNHDGRGHGHNRGTVTF